MTPGAMSRYAVAKGGGLHRRCGVPMAHRNDGGRQGGVPQCSMVRWSADTWLLAPAWPKGPALIAVTSMTGQDRKCSVAIRTDLLEVPTTQAQTTRENHEEGR